MGSEAEIRTDRAPRGTGAHSQAIRAGDAIMVKGSLGSKMKVIINALEKRFPGKAAHEEAV